MEDESINFSWLENRQAYTPELEDVRKVRIAFQQFAELHLSSDTQIRLLSASINNDIKYTTLNEAGLNKFLELNNRHRFNLFFINRFLVKPNEAIPADAAKLRMSSDALGSLASHIDIAPAFVSALSRYHLPTGRGRRKWPYAENGHQLDFWYSIPVRIKYKCTDSRLQHASSTGGSNQMDPFHYLHLLNHDIDIRGARIFLYFSHRPENGSLSVVAINMLDGRWPKTVEEPQKRIKDILQDVSLSTLREDPLFIHLVYFSTVLRWWTNALESVDMQLISYERTLQNDTERGTDPTFHEEINKALHAMAAHLHRYSSELKSLEETLADIEGFYAPADPHESQVPRIDNRIWQIKSQLQPIQHFASELEKKLRNILALLFNRIQLANDRAMVANSAAMQEILKATQEDTKASQAIAIRSRELTEEMKKDSLSMKTIAILTMFFLPGTSFAAILAMPFFSQNKWLDNVSKFWVWIVLTIPSTGLAFAFYTYWKRRSESGSKQLISEEGIELRGGANV